MVVLLGFLGIGMSKAGFIWLANPALFVAWLYVRQAKISFLFASMASVLAILFLFIREVVITEAGHVSEVNFLCTGYWLWLSSILVFATGQYVIHRRIRNQKMIK
ncbi:MAG: hypothetical protein ACRCYO_01150, partial [Bacteroidia bacterium]